MKLSHAYSNAAIVIVLATLVTASPTRAQDRDDDTLARSHRAYRHRAQIAAADELVAQLGSATEDLGTLYQLSRLLSEPCDQVRWLDTQIEQRMPFGTDTETRALAEEVLARLAELEQAQQVALRGCLEQLSILKALLLRIAEPPTPWELSDPAQLAARWRELEASGNADLQRELTPDRRLTLFARGIPAGELDLDGQHAWDQPRLVVDELAGSERLPAMWRLLQLDAALRGAEREKATWAAFTFPVDNTFRIARGLLDRAMGVDAEDQRAPTEAPDWSSLAARFKSKDHWAWAALAHILESGSREDPAAAAEQAKAQWDKLMQVNVALGGTLWPAVDGSAQAWLTRLQQRDNLTGSGLMPLEPDYRSARRSARRRLEQQFLQARNNPAEAFRIIQLVKAAGVGLDEREFQPITLDKMEERFQISKRSKVVGVKVFVLLEMIEIHRPGESSQYYAVMFNVTGWSWTGTSYDSAVIGPRDTPGELAAAYLDPRYRQLEDLRILIAADGPLDQAWFEFEKDELLPHVSPRSGRGGWLVYLPSVGALRPGAWSLDDTLRHFYQAARRSGETIDFFARGMRNRSYTGGGRPQEIADLLEKAPRLPLYALSIGPFPGQLSQLRPRGFVDPFKSRKKNSQTPLPAILVFTGQEP